MIIPVFDVKGNEFVCGKSGNRSTYTQLSSVYGSSKLEIVRNLRDSGAKFVYIADLDRIMGVGDNSDLINRVNEVVPVLLDNGASNISDVVSNRNICAYSILATETINSLDDVYEIFEEHPFEKIIFSIDIKDNEVLIKNKAIKLDDIISLINDVKPAYTIVLNISQVGTRKGNDSCFVRKIIDETPYTQHIMGGGVTNESIRDYKNEGIDNFLIGTILHDGTMFEEYKW